jgi:hypothetical protein
MRHRSEVVQALRSLRRSLLLKGCRDPREIERYPQNPRKGYKPQGLQTKMGCEIAVAGNRRRQPFGGRG